MDSNNLERLEDQLGHSLGSDFRQGHISNVRPVSFDPQVQQLSCLVEHGVGVERYKTRIVLQLSEEGSQLTLAPSLGARWQDWVAGVTAPGQKKERPGGEACGGC